MQGFSAAA